MDVMSAAMAQNMKMVRSALSVAVLDKAMGVDAQSMAAVLEMAPQQSAPQLAAKAGSMDIKV